MQYRALLGVGFAALSLTLLAACGSGGGAPRTTSSAAVTPSAPAATVAPLGATAAATPATNPVSRESGTVQSFDGQTVTLSDGTSFTLSPSTSLTRRQSATAADIKTGDLVAVTAKRQPDNTLLASMVVVFPSSFKLPQEQYTMATGDLMTNATVGSVQNNSFSVTFPGGSGQVTLGPNAQVSQIVAAAASDIKPGSSISAAVNNGVAQSVTIQ